jgi:hypothetical protein
MDDEQGDASDRRRAARIPVNAEFASMPSATYISDLSEYGVFVHTPNPSPRGTKLKLRFTVLLDDPVIVEGEGRVVRQQYEPVSGMGIEFSDLTPEMILRINDVVSRQRPRDLGPPLHRLFDDAADDDDAEANMLDTAQTLTRGSASDEPFDTAQTLRRGGGGAPVFGAPVFGASKGGFRPPPMPSAADENAKTGLYQPVDADIDDPDAEH